MKTTKEKVALIKGKIKNCADKNGLNSIIDILCYSQDEDPTVALAAVRGLQQIFAKIITRGDMASNSADKQTDPLCEWLQQQYHTTCDAMIDKLTSPDLKLREGALVTLMKFVEVEGKHPLHTAKSGSSFPENLLQDVVGKLVSTTLDQEVLISRLTELTEYDDVRFYLMKALKHHLGKTPVKDRTEVFLTNVLAHIFSLQLPQDNQDLSSNLLIPSDGEEVKSKVTSLNAHKKLFTACLMAFLRSDLTVSVYRKVLTKLDDKVLPFLSSPLLLADFLTQSYNVGGAISVLALNGLFILIHKYNLDYPDFYKKLYTLLKPQVLQAKYSARFFYLADIFLSSTHLPAYLVASFIKRISRLALTADPPGAKLCTVFVQNLMVRHPACQVLVHRPPPTSDPLTSDPFRDLKNDPANTCALDSSLWEIQMLQSHYSPEVAQEAMKISQPLKGEKVLDDLLEYTTDQMVQRVVKKKPPASVPLTPEKPTGLFSTNFASFFSLC